MNDEGSCSDCGQPVASVHHLACRSQGEVLLSDTACFDCGQDVGDEHLLDCQFRGRVY